LITYTPTPDARQPAATPGTTFGIIKALQQKPDPQNPSRALRSRNLHSRPPGHPPHGRAQHRAV